MELTKAQIRQLRSMCNTLSPTVSIGKAGVEAVVSAANENLESHELIKCSVQDSAGMSARDAAGQAEGDGFRRRTGRGRRFSARIRLH